MRGTTLNLVAAEYLFASSLLLTHLSRLAEDLIFFTSDEAAYAELPDAMATGSSRMPQKKNPDVLELTRGYAARSLGELTGFLALLKGLPLAYNKDLQLDKEPLFRTRTLLAVLLPALSALIAGLKINPRMSEAASNHLLLATDALIGGGGKLIDTASVYGNAATFPTSEDAMPPTPPTSSRRSACRSARPTTSSRAAARIL